MAPTKTTAIVLNLQPYRETSALVSLFTREFGLIRGVAKGIRSGKKDAVWLERGIVTDVTAYVKPHASLHLLTNFSVTEPFAATRSDLFKAAQRDGMLEVALKSIHEAQPHPELMTLFIESLAALEKWPAAPMVPLPLWRYYVRFTEEMGFGADLTACLTCGKPVLDSAGGNLRVGKGGLECARCDDPDYMGSFLPSAVLSRITGCGAASERPGMTLNAGECRRITGLLASFCQYHFETRSELKSVRFLDQLLSERY